MIDVGLIELAHPLSFSLPIASAAADFPQFPAQLTLDALILGVMEVMQAVGADVLGDQHSHPHVLGIGDLDLSGREAHAKRSGSGKGRTSALGSPSKSVP